MSSAKLFFLGAAFAAASLVAAPICPTTPASGQTGTDASGTGCSVLITFGTTGTATVTAPGLSAIDGSDDVSVGVLNNSTKALASITLTSATGTDAFGFESDGISSGGYTSANGVAIVNNGPTDPADYQGPTSTFDISGVVGGDGTLVVNFGPSIAANGGAAYFSLEGAPSISSGITVMRRWWWSCAGTRVYDDAGYGPDWNRRSSSSPPETVTCSSERRGLGAHVLPPVLPHSHVVLRRVTICYGCVRKWRASHAHIRMLMAGV